LFSRSTLVQTIKKKIVASDCVRIERKYCRCYNRHRITLNLTCVSSTGFPGIPESVREGAKRGQVAQVVERSPEKAGVGGSTPSLATIFSPKLNPCSGVIAKQQSSWRRLPLP
jgi:hypothetical protein